jgi:uncharacterized membrane protein
VPVTTLQWLLAFHVTGAFFLLGGVIATGVLGVLVLRARRPSEVALYLGLSRFLVVFIVSGAVLVLALGLWLVHEADFSYGSFWVIASIVLVVVSAFAGKRGGDREDETRTFALELAASGDEPSTDLHARIRDPLTLALSWGSSAAAVIVLALMIWRPGA